MTVDLYHAYQKNVLESHFFAAVCTEGQTSVGLNMIKPKADDCTQVKYEKFHFSQYFLSMYYYLVSSKITASI